MLRVGISDILLWLMVCSRYECAASANDNRENAFLQHMDNYICQTGECIIKSDTLFHVPQVDYF